MLKSRPLSKRASSANTQRIVPHFNCLRALLLVSCADSVVVIVGPGELAGVAGTLCDAVLVVIVVVMSVVAVAVEAAVAVIDILAGVLVVVVGVVAVLVIDVLMVAVVVMVVVGGRADDRVPAMVVCWAVGGAVVVMGSEEGVVATHASQNTGQMPAMVGMSHCALLIWLQKGTSSAAPLHVPSTTKTRVVVSSGAAVILVDSPAVRDVAAVTRGFGVLGTDGGGGVGAGVGIGVGSGVGTPGVRWGVVVGLAVNLPPTQQATLRAPEHPLRW